MSLFRTIRRMNTTLGITDTVNNLAGQAQTAAEIVIRNPVCCIGVTIGSSVSVLGMLILGYGIINFEPFLQGVGFAMAVIGGGVVVNSLKRIALPPAYAPVAPDEPEVAEAIGQGFPNI